MNVKQIQFEKHIDNSTKSCRNRVSIDTDFEMADNKEIYRIESIEKVKTYLSKLRYAIDRGARLFIQEERQVDKKPSGDAYE